MVKDYVIKTDPAANTKLSEGDKIIVYVSEGVDNDKIKVPEIIGLTEEFAKTALEEANLTVGKVTKKASDEREGVVIEQSIAVDTEVDKGTAIDIVVSSGKKEEESEKEDKKDSEKETEKNTEKEQEKQPEKQPEKEPEK